MANELIKKGLNESSKNAKDTFLPYVILQIHNQLISNDNLYPLILFVSCCLIGNRLCCGK